MSATKIKKVKSKGGEDGGPFHPKRANFDCELDPDAVSVENNGKVYVLSMDAREFNPEEINIRVTPTHVVIDGFHDTEEETTEFNEEIKIPEGAIHSTIECTMNGNGVLRIRADLQPKVVEQKAIEKKSIMTKRETTTTTESRSITTTTRSGIPEGATIIETKTMDSKMEEKILKDKKFVDSTKDLQPKDGKLEMNVDCKGFKDEDIKVNVSQRVVAIQASNQTNVDQSKEIHKKFIIPDGVDPTSFRTFLKKGVLTILMDDPKAAPGGDKTKKPPQAPVANNAPPPQPEPPVKLQTQVVESKDVEALERRCEDVTKKVATVDNKDKIFKAVLNVQGYKADELRMKVTRRVVIVHTETTSIKRQFNKKITIPAGVQPESITNLMSPTDGILTISGPIIEEPPSPAPTENVQLKPTFDLANPSTVTEPKFEDISKQISNFVAGSGKKFEVEVDAQGFKPDEVQVKILKSIVTIKGTRTVRTESQSSSSQFYKKFIIPQGVKAESLKCTFTTKGTIKFTSMETTTTTSSSSEQTTMVQQSISGSRIKPEILGTGLGSTNIVSGNPEAAGKFERKVDASGYKEDEIKITISNGWLTVNGKQQLGPELNFQTRQFTKKFLLPYGIKPNSIVCALQPNGTLAISAGGA